LNHFPGIPKKGKVNLFRRTDFTNHLIFSEPNSQTKRSQNGSGQKNRNDNFSNFGIHDSNCIKKKKKEKRQKISATNAFSILSPKKYTAIFSNCGIFINIISFYNPNFLKM
jgi:hypothetical protein